ncbi:DUF1761 domain-containing protein [Flammeovirga sp. SJP92]|uniref:DUF1761 domain-containing protein n=1 Tax=Flammeovirga sp. SJP92 TaxID=1775430 RepID=UPI0007873E74|nr:DUF1761 domain-containing protein [Flammeovirga sp. SJP92]KXX72504.1 hypothetical protein AVL50_00090 [Flammeovirga sp. SJP92]
MDFSSINFLAVLVAALVSFVFGAIWYNPSVFGKTWQKELGFTDEYLQEGSMPKIFGTSFILMLVMSFGQAMLMAHGNQDFGLHNGAMHGFIIGIMFVGCSMGINYLYQRRSIKLWLIDCGYQITFLTVQGAIIGGWPF